MCMPAAESYTADARVCVHYRTFEHVVCVQRLRDCVEGVTRPFTLCSVTAQSLTNIAVY